MTLTVSDVGADNYAISAHGTVRVTGCTGACGQNGLTVINPIGEGNGTLQLSDSRSTPAHMERTHSNFHCHSRTERSSASACSNTTVAMFIYAEMGSFNEFWNGPDFSAGDNPNNFLISAFDAGLE